mmetsp:Transcript_24964/g.77767  ORF Transcript_24964/g.77767 Transcript_24964/m.77767 type:complete len:346 (+) Transcript_24964:849-1886(+)
MVIVDTFRLPSNKTPNAAMQAPRRTSVLPPHPRVRHSRTRHTCAPLLGARFEAGGTTAVSPWSSPQWPRDISQTRWPLSRDFSRCLRPMACPNPWPVSRWWSCRLQRVHSSPLQALALSGGHRHHVQRAAGTAKPLRRPLRTSGARSASSSSEPGLGPRPLCAKPWAWITEPSLSAPHACSPQLRPGRQPQPTGCSSPQMSARAWLPPPRPPACRAALFSALSRARCSAARSARARRHVPSRTRFSPGQLSSPARCAWRNRTPSQVLCTPSETGRPCTSIQGCATRVHCSRRRQREFSVSPAWTTIRPWPQAHSVCNSQASPTFTTASPLSRSRRRPCTPREAML